MLLDLDLPIVHGEQVATAVRNMHGSEVAVIVLSAASDGRTRAYRAGADGFLAKPFDLDTVVEHVAEAVGI